MLSVFRSVFLAFFLSLGFAATAWAQPVTPAAHRDYVLGPGDVVEVEVLGQADFGKPRVKIAPDGTIPLPVLGTDPGRRFDDAATRRRRSRASWFRLNIITIRR